jgi:hypothetical protein
MEPTNSRITGNMGWPDVHGRGLAPRLRRVSSLTAAAVAVFFCFASVAFAGPVTPGWECVPTTAGGAVLSGGTGSAPSCASGSTAVLAPTYVASGVGGKPTVEFSTVNVQVVSGSGSTYGKVNGEGNLIVGYGENASSYRRTGSNDLVVGANNGWNGFGDLVAGSGDQTTGDYEAAFGLGTTASGAYAIVGGDSNVASGTASSVMGGFANTARGAYSAVPGGQQNLAADQYSVIAGGCDNLAGTGTQPRTNCGTGNEAILGGVTNNATGNWSAVSGGISNVSSGPYGSVSGGQFNYASGSESSVSGGEFSVASGQASSVSGGQDNGATGEDSSVSGGLTNQAEALWSSILGGFENTATAGCQAIPAAPAQGC